MADETTDGKSEEQLRREGEERARQANSRRNTERLNRLSAIADSAEEAGDHVGDEELTEEMLADTELTEAQRTARAIARAQAEHSEGDDQDERTAEIDGEETETDQGDEPRNDQGEEQRDDEAREAGADDVRVTNGVKEYRLTINGKTLWRTLAQIRASAQKVESADEYLETAVETAKRAVRTEPTSEEKQAAAQKRAERIAKRKDLLMKVAQGDEQAANELAELDEAAAPSAVTPDVLRALDERFDSRVSFREAVAWFEAEYAPELKHQAMKSYAGELDAALAAKNPQMPPKERLRRVGNQIRQELRETYGLTGGKAGPSNKARRKADGTRIPDAAGDRRTSREDEEEPEDTSSVIQKMAQARHQPRAVVHGPTRGR